MPGSVKADNARKSNSSHCREEKKMFAVGVENL